MSKLTFPRFVCDLVSTCDLPEDDFEAVRGADSCAYEAQGEENQPACIAASLPGGGL